MKYALLKIADYDFINIGDYIQSLSAKQYLPSVDLYLDRDELNNPIYNKAKVIMNGWFTFHPENWPPNPNLGPLFISFHLNPHYEILLKNKSNVEYLKKYAPIGCRDTTTVELLKKYGIDSYYSFCLTTTLDIKYKSQQHYGDIVFCDILFRYMRTTFNHSTLKKTLFSTIKFLIQPYKSYIRKKYINSLIPKEIQKKAILSNHAIYNIPAHSIEDLFKIAEDKIRLYSTAKLVVTSRIHCALPCLALNTPVLFVIDKNTTKISELARYKGVLNHINLLSNYLYNDLQSLLGKNICVYNPNEIDWNNPPQNPTSYKPYADKLKNSCKEFIFQDSK